MLAIIIIACLTCILSISEKTLSDPLLNLLYVEESENDIQDENIDISEKGDNEMLNECIDDTDDIDLDVDNMLEDIHEPTRI